MTFFYDLNKKLDSIREKPEVTHKQLNERDMSRVAKGIEKYGKDGMQALAKAGREGKDLDKIRDKYNKYDDKVDEGSTGDYSAKKARAGKDIGKPGKAFSQIAKSAGERYGSKERGEKVAGAVLAKLRHPKEDVEEGMMDTVKTIGKKVASGVNKLVGHGSDEEMRKDLQRKAGVPPTGKKPEQQVKEKLSPAKQKSFAALAPPRDKITFADKIAGAKKEVDEMLGDVAAEAMRKAVGSGHGRNAEMDEEKSKGTAFDLSAPRETKPKVGSVERGHKHDIKHTATGRVVTRRTDDQGHSVGADDESDADAAPRGRGRPKGTKNVSSKAKVFQRKSKLMTKEGEDDPAEKGEYDREGDMALDDIDTIESAANELQSIIDAEDNLPEWVQSKINKAMDYLDTARDYMAAQGNDQEPIAEKAVSKQQQKFMGMAHAMQKGEKIKGASKELKKVAKTMKPKDVEDFAATKHKGLPTKVSKKKKEEEVEESSTTAGSVATSTAAPKSGGSMSFGKGIYDSMNRELEKMIAESMNINMSNSTEGDRSLTITATDEDAMKLAMMLKAAGLGGQGGDMHSHAEPCPSCGMPDCGCGDVQEAVDENSPDWPTDTETSDDALQYAGGLNKPKTDVAGDGQTTVPNTAVHTQDEDVLRRMMEMAGMGQNHRLDEGMMDKLKSYAVPKLMKLLGPDAEKIANAVRQATGGDLTPSKENAMKVVQALGIDRAAAQSQSQMAEGIAGNWQGKLIQSLYTLGLLGSAAVTNWAYGPGRGTDLGVASGIITMIGVLLLMFAATFFGEAPGQIGAYGKFGNQGTDAKVGKDDNGRLIRNPLAEQDDLSRMMEMAGIRQADLEPWKETMKEEEEDFFQNPNVPKDKQLPPPPKEVDVELDEAEEEVEEDFLESIQRMREIAGIQEAKKDVEEEKTEEGNLFTGNLAKARADGKKEADLDGDGDMEKVRESIFTLTNQWRTYKG